MCVKRELERGGATKATIEREREKETERRTQELKRGQARNTRTTFFGMTASSAGALEENGEDHLYVLLLKRLALQARVADGGLEISVLLGGPAGVAVAAIAHVDAVEMHHSGMLP